ncbi:hypothetical protein AOLI_G00288460 [Acnodon oligacanthus]
MSLLNSVNQVTHSSSQSLPLHHPATSSGAAAVSIGHPNRCPFEQAMYTLPSQNFVKQFRPRLRYGWTLQRLCHCGDISEAERNCNSEKTYLKSFAKAEVPHKNIKTGLLEPIPPATRDSSPGPPCCESIFIQCMYSGHSYRCSGLEEVPTRCLLGYGIVGHLEGGV